MNNIQFWDVVGNLNNLDDALNSHNWSIRYAAICQLTVQPHHIDKALNDEERMVRHAAFRNPITTDDQKIEYKLKWNDIDD